MSPPQPGMEIEATPKGFTRHTLKKFNSHEFKAIQFRVGQLQLLAWVHISSEIHRNAFHILRKSCKCDFDGGCQRTKLLFFSLFHDKNWRAIVVVKNKQK